MRGCFAGGWLRAASSLGVLMIAGAVPGQTPGADSSAALRIIDAPFTDLHWRVRPLQALGSPAAFVVYFATIECPMVARSLPRIGEIARAYEHRDVVTVVVNVGVDDGFIDAAAQVAEHAPAAVFGKDFTLDFAGACGVDRSNTVLVLDRQRRVSYSGRIDDSAAYSAALARPRRDDLVEALDAVLSGRQVTVATTEVQGCRLTKPVASDPKTPPDYARDILPILTRTCLGCHLHDPAGGIDLASVARMRKHAAMIDEVIGNGRMPPWRAATLPGVGFLHRGLGNEERRLLRHWIAGGLQLSPLPTQPVHPMRQEWRTGPLPVVLDAPEEVRVPATGALEYRYMVLDREFAHDTWIEAIDVRSGQSRALQHCNLAIVRAGDGYRPEAFLTNYTPHGVPLELPQGSAFRIPAGSRLAVQAYYQPFGQAVSETLQVGLRYARFDVRQPLEVTSFGATDVEIPAGARASKVEARLELAADCEAVSLFVHMHARGRCVSVVAESANGTVETLLSVPAYDFAGQQTYAWPLGTRRLAAGTVLRAVGHFDNSDWNPANPDPKQVVRSGPAVADEQFQVSIAWRPIDDREPIRIDPATGIGLPVSGAAAK